MKKMQTQEQRLDYLINAFLEESEQQHSTHLPSDPEGKRRVLRSLMNIRPPKPLPQEVLDIQDAYLSERVAENGVVTLSDIPTVKDALASTHPSAAQISIWQGDITRLAVDAIVNAANAQMLGCFVPLHACIDNCIHTFAGVQLRLDCHERMEQLRKEHGADYVQPTAIPMLTDAYNLPSQHVIHIVGPIVQGALTPELEEDLAKCYRSTLDLCAEHGLRSVAFCCISTGVFRFPNERAAQIATEVVADWLAHHSGAMDRVIFNVFKDEDFSLYQRLLA